MSEPEEGRPGVERWIRPFFEDSTLWPVLIVAVLIFATCGAALLALAVRERSLPAFGALAILAWMSADALRLCRRSGRLGLAGWAIAGLWALSAGIAALAVTTGVF